jgi:dGTPase
VGRALAKALCHALQRGNYKPKFPDDKSADDLGSIVQAACLAHDLGNPPFGHAGEEAIINWFDNHRARLPEFWSAEYKHDISSLEGNAQGFRIITQLENHIFDGGLRLTYATLGAFQKYPWTSKRSGPKFGAYISEEKILDRVCSELGMVKRDHGWCRHPLAHLVEAADDICYGIMDIEDAVELGILTFEKALSVLFMAFSAEEKESIQSSFGSESMHRVNFARMRGKVFDKLTNGVVEAFLNNYTAIMAGDYDDSLFELLPEDDSRRNLIKKAKELGRNSIYIDMKKTEIELGCYATFDTLLSQLCEAALNQSQVLKSGAEVKLNWKSQHILRLIGDHAPARENAPPGGWTDYECLRRVIDFVSGMTDNYAIYVARQLQGAGFSGIQRP